MLAFVHTGECFFYWRSCLKMLYYMSINSCNPRCNIRICIGRDGRIAFLAGNRPARRLLCSHPPSVAFRLVPLQRPCRFRTSLPFGDRKLPGFFSLSSLSIRIPNVSPISFPPPFPGENAAQGGRPFCGRWKNRRQTQPDYGRYTTGVDHLFSLP